MQPDPIYCWLEDPKALFSRCQVLACAEDESNEKVNCLTRLLIAVAVILYVSRIEWASLFLLLSILAVIILYVSLTVSTSIRADRNSVTQAKSIRRAYLDCDTCRGDRPNRGLDFRSVGRELKVMEEVRKRQPVRIRMPDRRAVATAWRHR